MAQKKPSLAKGTRDFSPEEMRKRNYIFRVIQRVFEKHAFQEIQTPSFENLQTLTGKYGEEGDRLIFKILNSGDFLSGIDSTNLQEKDSQALAPVIAEKALRYDLTVPFARYVVMHQNDLVLPFKRYQIQPVWRADRPQKGRYREFYQCDVDVVGSKSLLYEAEFLSIYEEVFRELNIAVTIKINNRKLLAGLANLVGQPDLLVPMTVAIDKLDKIGVEGVKQELLSRGFSEQNVQDMMPVLQLSGTNQEKLSRLAELFIHDPIGLQGVKELDEVFNLAGRLNKYISGQTSLDISLARGLNYYTGCIIEVQANQVQMGSIGGGGRYDDLTAVFGLKGLTGVGISFGADRIYDVLAELDLFPDQGLNTSAVLITNLSDDGFNRSIDILRQIRSEGITAELYPEQAKLKKQLNYADKNGYSYAILIGEDELRDGLISLKNLASGDQIRLEASSLIAHLKSD